MWSVPELLVCSVALSIAVYYYFLERKKTLKNFPPVLLPLHESPRTYYSGNHGSSTKLNPSDLNSFENNSTTHEIRPWGFPVVGHFPLFGSNPAKTFTKWKKIYGPIFTVRFGGIRSIILNDSKVNREAFHMDEFSGRPHLPVFVEMTGGKGLGFIDGPDQVEQRRFVTKTLKEHGFGKSSVEFRMHEEITKFLSNLKAKPEVLGGKPMEMNKLFRFCLSNVLWDAMMGSRFDENDPTLLNLLKLIDKGGDTNGSIISQLFYFFPWIARIGSFVGYNPPVQAFKTIYNFIEKQIDQLRPFYVKWQPKHFTDAYFDKVSETVDVNSSFHASKTKKQQHITTGDVFMAGIDTMTNSVDWLMIYLAREPEIQQKLQIEIDTVIGTDLESRVPCLADRPHMPYTEAVLHELLRITSVVPHPFHRTIQDVNFKGYRIPKNTMVISNLYAVNHDPETWQHPEKFDPERFLNEECKLNKLTGEVMSFGVGKRNCIGEGFARDQLFLLATNFFRQFSVLLVEGQIPSLDFKVGLVSIPNKFNLHVMERSTA